jgi:hypothetical protein
MAKLTGQEILDHRTIRRQQGMTNAQIVRDAGYVYIRKDGTERVQYTEYYENILIAQGKMFRVTFTHEKVVGGIRIFSEDSYTTSLKSKRSIARNVRALTNLSGVKCRKTVHSGVVTLRPYKSSEVVTYTLP